MADRLVATFFWRHLAHSGHEACRLFRRASGWLLRGCAVFRENARVCELAYAIATTADWRSQHATIDGYAGRRAVRLRIEREARSRWRMNGHLHPRVEGCVDLDLAFTPATNLVALRRLALANGESGGSRAAYLEFPSLRLSVLDQTYRRVSPREYAYAAPRFDYAERLRVTAHGAVIDYPGLFELVPARP